MLLSTSPLRDIFGHGPRILATRLVSAPPVGYSVPTIQAQIADTSNNLDSNKTNLQRRAFHSTASRGEAPPSVRPVASAVQHQQQQQQQQQPGDEFWRKVPLWSDVSAREFLSYSWSTKPQLLKFLQAVLPDEVPSDKPDGRAQTRDQFIQDVFEGITAATMAVRMTPYILSRINWHDPRNDPIVRQFLPLKSRMLPDHPKLTLDSLHEEADSPVKGLVHRYPDKALFLPTSVCPTYCTFCTRSYAVGADTATVSKASLKPGRRRWEEALAYIGSQPGLSDVVVSGGDAYYLTPEQLTLIGERLVALPNVRRFRFASKGLAVAPGRVLDGADAWADALVRVSDKARRAGKAVAWHTHFNHPAEISWVTERASQRLFEEGVVVRNQTVLLRGVNDDVETMGTLIRRLADNNIFPYYVYQCDMVKSVEHLRTPLQTILDLEAKLRGSIAGFMMPSFVVDLPGGGGKRLACSFESYDRATGVSRYKAPAITGRDKKNKVYEYYDPVDSLPGNTGS
ncbi:hypothetical protein MYCTH_40990 [Thermothelomyces thermophilus ATCC 42464]|uniref:Radical SAM core domain-containing protein n=1 Tax=Thermothelomyces thermophilus (strain ATCC 42464 / BCRC 31852 / DSM 1799) TaxID=573729 RepID=G2Q385_THET4|nr:uncharacterized protein MYCTH_40990 [Thermothelomyces thermophilus ATCC 42464]AEO54346.1 hypothetical protein MYCTH_40990 [Thermothelomyces thermophilus ATCC 42464]